MALVKREKKKNGIKILSYGEAGSGKSPFGLSFPNSLLFDPDTSTTFYVGENVLMESTANTFTDVLKDLADVERDKQLMINVETVVIDSMTRYVDKQEQAALKVAEKRARSNGRDVEGETISMKERNVMKLNYERAFGKLMEFVQRGKNLFVIAEQKDKTENQKNADGSVTFVKAGIVPSMPKDSDYDFDVIVHTYKENGTVYGKIEKDRTNTFKVGDVIEKPNFSHWEEAISKAQKGRERDEAEIRKFDEDVEKEAESFADPVEKLHNQMKDMLIAIKDQNLKDNTITPKFMEIMNTANFLAVHDVSKLEKAHAFLKTEYDNYKK